MEFLSNVKIFALFAARIEINVRINGDGGRIS